MQTALSPISGHVPPKVRDKNFLVRRLLDVLDAMQVQREDGMEYYRRSFMPHFAQEMKIMRWWVDNFGGEYTSETTLEALDCFYWNAYYIYSRKGTKEGLERLLSCLIKTPEYNTSMEVTEFVIGKPLILFDSWRPNDTLPNGQDIADEEVNSPPKYVPTLLGGSWEEHKNYIELSFDLSSNSLTPSYQEFLEQVLRKYCPAIGEFNLIIDIVYSS